MPAARACGPDVALAVGVKVGLGLGEAVGVEVEVGVFVKDGVGVADWVEVAGGEGRLVGGKAVEVAGAGLALGLASMGAAGALPWHADKAATRNTRPIR